jgi:hypothetical protein
MRRSEGGANIFEVFRVKNHNFTPKNHIFSNFGGGGRAPGAPPLDPPMITWRSGLLVEETGENRRTVVSH